MRKVENIGEVGMSLKLLPEAFSICDGLIAVSAGKFPPSISLAVDCIALVA